MIRFYHVEEIYIENRAFNFDKIQECFPNFNRDDFRNDDYTQLIFIEWVDCYKEVIKNNPIETLLIYSDEFKPYTNTTHKRDCKILFYTNLIIQALDECFGHGQIQKYKLKIAFEEDPIFVLRQDSVEEYEFTLNWYNTFLFYLNNMPKTLEEMALFKMIECKIDVPYKNISFFRNVDDLIKRHNRYDESYVRTIIFIKKSKIGKQIMDFNTFNSIEPETILVNNAREIKESYFYKDSGYVRYEMTIDPHFVTTINIYRFFNRNMDLKEYYLCSNKQLVVINNHEINYNNILNVIKTRKLIID